jgi:hypothetical protein
MTRATRPAADTKARQRKYHQTAKLDALIEDATVDAHDESEQRAGFYTMLEDHLAIPFTTKVLGMDVTVERICLTDDEEIVAVCARGRSRQGIRIVDLPLPDPPPKGMAWIEAYRRSVGRR